MGTLRASILAICFVTPLSLAVPAGAETGVGVGAEALLTGPVGPTVVYQAERFHLAGLLAIDSESSTQFVAAGRFWFEAHSGDNSDFSVGGGLGFLNISGDDNDDTDVFLEAGAQLRAFLTSNVALSATVGFSIFFDEGDDRFRLSGQLTGGMGMTYFFF